MSPRDRALNAVKGRSSLKSGDRFAFAYWSVTVKRFPAVSWESFLEWEMWQIAATLGLDKTGPSDTDQALLDEFSRAARPPSPNRKG